MARAKEKDVGRRGARLVESRLYCGYGLDAILRSKPQQMLDNDISSYRT